VNPYDILQVSPKADDEVIRAAYRSLMQRYHPDKNPHDEQAAEKSASITQAYELLSDPQRKAALDAAISAENAMKRNAVAHGGQALRHARPAKQADHPSRPRALLLPVAAALVCIVLVWWTVNGLLKSLSPAPPAQQLADIRSRIENVQTAEAERRKLFALKQSLIEQHPDLAASERSQRLDDLAARSVALLTEPLAVNLATSPSLAMPPVQLLLPEITLVLGSFDAPRLQAHIQKHRTRIVHDLAQQLALQSASLALSSDAEARIKRVIRDTVMASLEIRSVESYPSTYFESPARHGVVDVILPNGFAALK
jgi:curved DNA-binding protein CbpA